MLVQGRIAPGLPLGVPFSAGEALLSQVRAIAKLADSRVEAAVFETSYGYGVTVRYLNGDTVLGTATSRMRWRMPSC